MNLLICCEGKECSHVNITYAEYENSQMFLVLNPLIVDIKMNLLICCEGKEYSHVNITYVEYSNSKMLLVPKPFTSRY